MKKQPLKALALISALVGGLTATAVQATEVSDVLKAGAAKVQTAKTSQTKVDRIADQTDELLQEFKQVNKQIESLRVYNSQLDRQIDSQKVMMAELKSPLLMLRSLREAFRHSWLVCSLGLKILLRSTCRLRKAIVLMQLLI